ncbi:Retrovirus-related Pol polyprotein from transposon TNT 1-94 [Apostasia shenzhenica]|uniref:Retrovirus-related Pol polyprotein from transposon TNT 1-94 n=1 Tax=Apostasia shenzhenica TaxID=1088818 RepID=A0A2I0AR78_9ASPA|nr:Retrovirus-related Pol polyprotein from transposon TNT 1-94 [Apostasia shenzhenica]
MKNAKAVNTPLAQHFKLSLQQCLKSDKEFQEIHNVPYANAVGCLIYAIICTRPDLSHAVSVVSRYMANPKKEHWNALKWILRYLKGTSDCGLLFKKNSDSNLLLVMSILIMLVTLIREDPLLDLFLLQVEVPSVGKLLYRQQRQRILLQLKLQKKLFS